MAAGRREVPGGCRVSGARTTDRCMAKRDYYKVLDLARNASEAEIKKAYRRLAMKYHPDRNPGDHDAEEQFKEAKEAYEVLSESQKRAVYDQYGHAGLEASRNSGGGASGFTGAEAFSDIFGDVFGDIFGGARRGGGGPQAYRGADLRYEAELDLHEAVFGRSIEIDVKKFSECELCHGSGAAKGSQPVHLRYLQGQRPGAHLAGLLHPAADLPPLPRHRAAWCATPVINAWARGVSCAPRNCRSRFRPASTPAIACGWSVKARRAATAARLAIFMSRCGCASTPIFERDGVHLSCEVPIGFTTATLGGSVEVPTLDGQVVLKIPAETQSGRVFRLQEKGVKSVRGPTRGDLFCRVVVETPVHLSSEQRALLREFDESLKHDGNKHSPRQKSFLDGVKSFFTGAEE